MLSRGCFAALLFPNAAAAACKQALSHVGAVLGGCTAAASTSAQPSASRSLPGFGRLTADRGHAVCGPSSIPPSGAAFSTAALAGATEAGDAAHAAASIGAPAADAAGDGGAASSGSSGVPSSESDAAASSAGDGAAGGGGDGPASSSGDGAAPEVMVPQPVPRAHVDAPRGAAGAAAGARTPSEERTKAEIDLQRAAGGRELHALISGAPEPLAPEALRIALSRAAVLVQAKQQQSKAAQGVGAVADEEAVLLNDALIRLTTRLVQVHGGLDVPQLAAILHSYAKLQLLPGTVEFMAQLVGRLKGRISSGAGVDGKVLAMLGWSLARLGCTNETVLAELARAAEQHADAMTVPQLRQLLWAAATLPLHDWQLIATLSRAAARRVRARRPRLVVQQQRHNAGCGWVFYRHA
ncbi:hypothetical protein MNEG_6095 [Monoraphidium neglectum]|uniref:Uncharacterized protein n=1 Tax=Monoraphidium neglectum TaxID=145388 RepID=A0A0D2L3U9_9CHLO|nr:hypothetical protein MNEG_6095 [Monoraphidium neglectum]KIZ01869.1 hypothetical protein MNEG_6095 [Monoraphidium neglectum]|eukprot:XP_013900888.1 hypothetical protein MNEG_6095 [Monoraphidium neglectum]